MSTYIAQHFRNQRSCNGRQAKFVRAALFQGLSVPEWLQFHRYSCAGQFSVYLRVFYPFLKIVYPSRLYAVFGAIAWYCCSIWSWSWLPRTPKHDIDINIVFFESILKYFRIDQYRCVQVTRIFLISLTRYDSVWRKLYHERTSVDNYTCSLMFLVSDPND